MTNEEYWGLDQNTLYNFHLYWGETKSGYLAEQENSFFIVLPTSETRGKEPKEIGYRIKLEQIETWELINQKHSQHRIKNTSFSLDGNLYAKTLVIFGAGASFDYSFNESTSIKPPLATNLFSDDYEKIITNYPGARSLSSQILRSKNIEEYFQKQWDRIESSHNQLLLSKLINTQFYLRHLFQHVSNSCIEERKNNYNNLVQTIYDDLTGKDQNERAIFVTFNYDTLLEKAITSTINYPFKHTDDYINTTNRFLLFKPHGSWNWGRKINKKFFDNHNINKTVFNTLTNKFLYEKNISQSKIHKFLEEEIEVLDLSFSSWENSYFPSLLIPFSKKDTFIMPENHKVVLEHFLSKIERIIAVGWKGSELSFQQLLQKKLSTKKLDIVYVNLKDATFEKEMKNYLPNAIFKEFAPWKDSKGTFSEFTEFLMDHENLIF